MKTSFEYDIFISYSQKDRAAAERLQAALEARRLKVWCDRRLAENPAADFIGQIDGALARSRRVLVLWSRSSVASSWVRAEAGMARRAAKIVPLALEPLTALLPLISSPFDILPTLDASSTILELEPILRALGAEQAKGEPAGVFALAGVHADISKLPDTYAQKLYGRGSEMAELIEAWDGGQTRIFALDAMGGAGKTALVHHFAQALKASGWRGARSVFAWSFHGQGSNGDRQTSANDFFDAAFAHFSGGRQAPPRDPHRKGVDLAHLVRARRALLILDGLEPLQYAAHGGPHSSVQAGGIKDPSARALLKALADDNPGLCVVATRIELAELKGAEGVTFKRLEEIPPMEAIALLRDLGVEPSTPPASHKLPPAREFAALTPAYEPPAAYWPADERPLPAIPAAVARDLIEAVRELKGHALALTLAGRHLAQHMKGGIRAIRELPSLPQLPQGKERAPYRVMRAIEIALANRIAAQGAVERPASDAAGRQLALLFFLGLFDRPVSRALLPVVFCEDTASLTPSANDIEVAKLDPIPMKRRLHVLDEELLTGDTPEWRKEQLEQLRQPLQATQRAVIEARRRVLVRRLFAGMHAIVAHEDKIGEALSQLAEQGLISHSGRAGIDCHPLVRDYFGMRLKELDAETFRAAHGRLYDHCRYAGLPPAFRDPTAYSLLAYKAAFPDGNIHEKVEGVAAGLLMQENSPNLPPAFFAARREQLQKAAALICGPEWERALAHFLPKTGKELPPLFAAVAHGCLAEREQEAWSEVYRPRIAHGNEEFAVKKLGLSGQDLAALANFFETPFTVPSPRLAPGCHALLLGNAGFRLHALGRLEEAVDPIRAAAQLQAKMGDMENAASGFCNLSQLLAALGRLSGGEGAVAASEAAVTFADRSQNAGERIHMRAAHAFALVQAGGLARAEALFREAEALLKEQVSHLPCLYSLQGYLYCDLLFARGRSTETATRAASALDVAKRGNWPLDIGLDTLSQARAALAAVPPTMPAPQDCAARSGEALAVLHRANAEEFVTRSLLVHAEALWRCQDANAAAVLLREAEAIARRGPMPLFLADAHLLAARIQLAEGRNARARTCRDQAAALIERHGYGRGAVELAVLSAEIACADKAAGRDSALATAIEAVRGEPYRDERTGIAIDGGWWGLLPRLEVLLPVMAPGLAGLRAARDTYNAERDVYLAAREGSATEERAAPAMPAGPAGHILASEDACAAVEQVLLQKGIGQLDSMKPGERHDGVREAVYAVLAETLELNEKTPAADRREVPDALVKRVFADPEMQGPIRDLMRQHRLGGAAAGLPFETKRFIAGKLKEHRFVKVEVPPRSRPAPPLVPPLPAKKRGWWPLAGK